MRPSRMRIISVLIIGLLTGCLFKRGAPESPPPVSIGSTTAARADSLWQVAEEAFRHGRWDRTIETLDRTLLLLDFADSRRARAYFMIGESRLSKHQNLQAVREFRRVADEVASEELAPDALLRAGDAYSGLWSRPELDPSYGETALLTYNEVIERYPGTTAAKLAQLRILDLRERFAQKELLNAMFYFKFKAFDSAILSFRSLIATYPRTSAVPAALVKLVEAYRINGYDADLRETCEYVERFFPQVVPSVAQDCAVGAQNPS
jgi:outer membrane protein assembly factor BamD